MSKKAYPLQAILHTICKIKKIGDHTHSVTKRTLFNKAALGHGISSRKLVLLFLSLPFIEFALIFNPVVFEKLGIAQSIVFYIVFMSIIMMIIFGISYKNNRSVMTKIVPSWEEYFPDIDLKLVLSSGISPYNKFFVKYAQIVDKNLAPEDLQPALREAFDTMKEENRDLLEAIERDNSRS